MKKIIAVLIVSASLFAFKSNAQTSQPMQKHSMAGMQQMLKDSLHLTDVQVDSVTSIRQQMMGQVMSIRNDTSLSTDQKQEQMKAARQQMKMRLKTVLSKEQMQQMEEMQRNMRKGNANGGGGEQQ